MFNLLRINLLQQSVCMSPSVHHEQHEADVNTDTASQHLVEVDVVPDLKKYHYLQQEIHKKDFVPLVSYLFHFH